ncbi:MAG: hypothetical protein HFI57_03705 [Lachnospiraceae bacterium]|nr:hypothetical protein [Lachnospiraceae bacterium]
MEEHRTLINNSIKYHAILKEKQGVINLMTNNEVQGNEHVQSEFVTLQIGGKDEK